MYGIVNERGRQLDRNLALLDKLGGHKKIKSIYNVSYPIDGADSLVQVEAIPEFMPHLVTWSSVAVPRKGKLGLFAVNRLVKKHLNNMVEEERKLVGPMIYQLVLLHEINAVDVYDETFILHCTINGEAKSAVITVFNLIEKNSETENHLWRRDSLN
ncbi:hypothetical protein PHABIO_393 [Pseudomonas phage Phabio]|uniref:Uncharacterized protein n=1 Tax=Pseudomonas phage Phabio TaxID=2006668 RepID=A0A1Y0SWR0_9CAUD|nr:hypothetical protein MZD05_gp393 [Pseudomonas phage Phabio]ARV77024.1 hypothetical protein PHABIO_393 [Pseudomonas phage Phabio]